MVKVAKGFGARKVVDLAKERTRRGKPPASAPRPVEPLQVRVPADRIPNVLELYSHDGAIMEQIEAAKVAMHPHDGHAMPSDELLLRAYCLVGRIDDALTNADDPIWPALAAVFDHMNAMRTDAIRARGCLAAIERALEIPMEARERRIGLQQLRLELELREPRFASVPDDVIYDQLLRAQPASHYAGKNIGRNMRSAPAVFIVLCLAAGAFGVPRAEAPTNKQIAKAKDTIKGLLARKE